MARTPSTMLDLGTTAPDFNLPEPLSGQNVALNSFQGKPLLVAFICNHCPFVLHILDGFVDFAKEYQDKGLHVVAINANNIDTHPDDSPEKMVELIQQRNITFPYLYDESQQTAKAYQAACTPDFYLFDQDRKLVYRGQFDGARPQSDIAVTGEDMRRAADAVLAGEMPDSTQAPSLGCNIKWKPGNEPEYFG